MVLQTIRPTGANIGPWNLACTAVAAVVAVISSPVTVPAGGAIGSLTATFTGHDNYSGLGMLAGMVALPVLTGVTVVVASLAAVKLGLVRVPERCR